MLTAEHTEGLSSYEKPRFVVGIGASAGGLEALESFFDHLPDAMGMAFVVVQHLSPDFRSMMNELLARHTRLPIHLVENGMPVEANHVYLIPPKKEMIIAGGRLLLSEKERQQEFPLPIDMFFRSLAQDCGPKAVAIVLSGGGSDGSRGARDVHDAGGLVVVQDVATAQFGGMPKTVSDAGVADFVLPPGDMGRVLKAHGEAAQPTRSMAAAKKKNGSQAHGVEAIYQMLEQEFGLDFTVYKPSTVTRRIERRLALARSEDIEQYVERLRAERGELDVLYRDLLIGVTRFFRNEEAFELLKERVLPELWKREPREAPLRVWVAGCATGEEAYSLAIVLNETAQRLGERPVKIFATDVHHGSLERAGRGMYDEEAVSHVSPERLARYFLRNGNSYQLLPEVRQMVVFAAHNVIRDAPFTRVDLVSCRNMLIYLQLPAQQKVLALFHFALNRGGILLLGPSESPGHLAHDFETVDGHWHIYRKFSDARMSVSTRLLPSRTTIAVPTAIPPSPRHSLTQLLSTYDALLEKHMPPSLLVSESGELVHAFGGASRFLVTHDGRQGLDIVDLAQPELKPLLVGGLRRAFSEPTAIAFTGISLTTSGETGTYKVTISRVPGKNGSAAHALVSFERTDIPERLPAPVSETQIHVDRVSQEQVGVLQAELLATKENLQSAIEELQTSNEELQAANEELLASNEELQSTNEELQSVNEELYTVNAEYQRKIAELTEVTNDMNNLLSSTDVGTIFLDTELRIRRFTPQIADTFKLVVQDIGRPIETFTHTMNHPELIEDLRRCVSMGERVERELRDVHGKSFFLRILPYRAKGVVDGVVLTIIDISSLKAAEDALFHERYLLDSLLRSIPDAIYFRDARGRFIRANDAMASRLGLPDARAAVEKMAFELLDEASARALVGADEVILRTGEAQLGRLEKRAGAMPGADRWDLVTRLPLTDQAGQAVGTIGVFRDVTTQKCAEEKLQEELRRRDQFLAMLSHELRNPLSAIVTSIELLKSEAACAPEARGRVLGVLHRQSAHMAHLLDDLLEASRVTQNKIELRKATIDLRISVREAADALRPAIEATGIALSVDVDASPLFVDGDATRLQQIHTNLINNAMKYTPEGGHIALRASREGPYAVVRIRDDGVGIPKDMLGSIFDLFVQSRQTLDRSNGGLGLGLTVVRSLVAMHGGEVIASSEGEGQGSEFTVRLPLAQPPEAEAEPPPPMRRPPRRGARIVVIEDNADSRQVLCEFLELVGYECKGADNGASGLALIHELRPQLAIIDLGLPGMDGLELARRLRTDPRHAEVYLIALSGYGQPADKAASRAVGFDEHLVKPVRIEELLARLSDQASPSVGFEVN